MVSSARVIESADAGEHVILRTVGVVRRRDGTSQLTPRAWRTRSSIVECAAALGAGLVMFFSGGVAMLMTTISRLLIGTVVVLLIGVSLVVAWPLFVIALGIIVLMKATADREPGPTSASPT